MKKSSLQAAATVMFESMEIALANRVGEPISAIIHLQSKNSLGFIKVDLVNPSTDCSALLKRNRIFTLQLQDLNYSIGKVEKVFDIPSTPTIKQLEIQSPILAQITSR